MPALAGPLGQVGNRVALWGEERGDQGDVASPEAWRVHAIPEFRSTKVSGKAAKVSRVSHEGQVVGFNHVTRWSSTPRALSQRDRGACDGSCPPHARPDKRPARGEIHALSRADAEHGMHAGLDEEDEMGVGTQAAIRHEHIPGR